ncbi:TetR/AcrR family transcriptional regulator [Brevibacterium daeguense]|uniref:TetR/AcrR family transcriptional regulator n=1 Tax=Brevibacterium daeguense TaxID=909936 RepID=A0ABP8EIT8_9MICO|nr:TetR family transcriptional regulator [Brevibacterium daeguense]
MTLTPESIVDTSLEVLSQFGMGDLSMRRLARELQVQPSALYWHVKNKQELFVLIAQRFTAEVDARCPASARPTPAVTCLALRDVLLAYRDGAEIFTLAYSLQPETVIPEALATALESQSLAVLLSFVLGQLMIEQNRSLLDVADDSAEDTFAAGLTALLRAT